VADVLAPLMGQSYNTLRERLRDSYWEAGAKAGKQRTELDCHIIRLTNSKYNPIKRCWGIFEQHWDGAKLVSAETMLGWAKTYLI
jgi:hypothetical protein